MTGIGKISSHYYIFLKRMMNHEGGTIHTEDGAFSPAAWDSNINGCGVIRWLKMEILQSLADSHPYVFLLFDAAREGEQRFGYVVVGTSAVVVSLDVN